MAGIPNKFSFNRDVLGGEGDVALEMQASDNPAILAALASNAMPVPKPEQPLILGSASLKIEAGKDLTLGKVSGAVGFSASAGSKFGIFGEPGQLRDGIIDGGDLAEAVEPALDFTTGSGQPFMMLRWGYDVNGTASGAMALGAAGKLTFSANAGRQGLYAIIQQPSADVGCRDALAGLVRSVRLPKQVKSVDDMAPASWIVAETDSSVGFRADVKFGQDFTWIRETRLGALKGDIGLKLALGLSAGLGFSAAGKYAVVLGRQSAEAKLRFRVFKLRMHEWDFAFKAQATVTGKPDGLLPEKFDDFFKGILGVHSSQVMRALARVDDWTDPSKPLFGPFVNLADDKARALVSRITGIEDLSSGFDAAKSRIKKLFDAWDNLPADATERIMALAGNAEALGKVRDLAKKVAGGAEDELKALLKDQLKDLKFLQSEEGKILEKLAEKGLFEALTNSGLLTKLQDSAKKVGDLLDGSVVEESLKRLQAEIAGRLKLSQIEDAVNSASLDKLDSWFKAKLEDFIEDKLVGADGVAKLNELRESLRKVRESLPSLYEKARAALERDYNFSISATYKKTTTTTALVDLEFDFGAPGSQAAEGLRLALQGAFDDVMMNKREGVTLLEGALTHGVTRSSNVNVVLPFFSSAKIHTNKALAQLSTVAKSGGQLFYTLEAEDLVSVKNKYTASLTISMQLLQSGTNSGVMVHSPDSATYRQSLDRVFFEASTSDLIQYAGPFVTPLFPGDFGNSTFAEWAGNAFGRDAELGHALMALDVTLPASACLAWLKAPGDKKDEVYQQLSTRLQVRFKQLVHDTFFHRIGRYKNVSGASDARSILVFCSLPPATDARLNNGKVAIAPGEFSAPGEVYWDFLNLELLRKMGGDPRTVGRLVTKLAQARARLDAAQDPDHVIGAYKESQISEILNQVIHPKVLEGGLFHGLLLTEQVFVSEIRAAALAMAEFKRKMNDPKSAGQAREALEKFGSKVTDAFNANLKGAHLDDAVTALGALMFIEAAKVFDPSLELQASAMFNITDVRDEVRFPPDNFPNHDTLPAADIVHSETLVHTN